jgi:phospholipase/lecithinase/hemolysin
MRALSSFLGISAIFMIAAPCLAQPYTGLVVFGDSLSDAGNSTCVSLGIAPGSAYWQGRYSNGPVYVERLSSLLGLGEVKCSASGGTNFASGGAQTTGTRGNREAFVDDLDEQLARYLKRDEVDPGALHIVWVGANDFLEGQRDVKVPIKNIITTIEKLYDAGARRFLVMNLPMLGSSPRYHRRPDRGKMMNRLTKEFNKKYTPALDKLEKKLAEIELVRFDVEAYFDDVVANPEKYSLEDVKLSAAPGLDVGTLFYNKQVISATPEKFLYWDIVHPTTTMHAHLADALYERLQEHHESVSVSAMQ